VFEIFWSTLGSLLIGVIYISSLLILFPSIIVFVLIYLLNQACNPFELMVQKYMLQAKNYLLQAKEGLLQGRDAAASLLTTFKKWQDMQKYFDNTGMNTAMDAMRMATDPQVVASAMATGVFGAQEVAATTSKTTTNTAALTTAAAATKTSTAKATSSTPVSFGAFGIGRRMLMDALYSSLGVSVAQAVVTQVREVSGSGSGQRQRFLGEPSSFGLNMAGGIDPEALLIKGTDIMDVLNQTIVDTEKQILYYEHVSSTMADVCYDFVSLRSAVQWVVWGCVILMLSQILMYAHHVKRYVLKKINKVNLKMACRADSILSFVVFVVLSCFVSLVIFLCTKTVCRSGTIEHEQWRLSKD